MARIAVLVACVIALVSPALAASSSTFIQAEARGTYTSNVFLSPTATNDFVTSASLWLRQPVKSAEGTTIRLKADLKAFTWADKSFDGYTYSLFGADYRKHLRKGTNFRAAYGYVSNDSYDFEAPFHLYKGHQVSLGYEFPLTSKWSGQVDYVFGTRDWDAAASGRNGTGHELRSTFTRPIAGDNEVSLVGKWEKENTDDPADEYSRYTAGLGITHYLRGKSDGPQISADYRYKFRNYSSATREDVENVYSVELSTPAGTDNTALLRYAVKNNNSTVASRTYDENTFVFSLQRKF